jgi:hypothetical protein
VAGPDDLLLLLTHLWARDKSVFPTEDNRHDVATVMLFQAYTGGRPAEFVHTSKGKACQDPLGEAEEAKNKRPPKRGYENDGLQYDDDSEAGDGPDYDDDIDYDDEGGDNAVDDVDLSGRDADESADHDSGYNSDETDTPMTEGSDDCYTVL